MAPRSETRKSGRPGGNANSHASEILRRPFLISIGALAIAEEQASSVIDSLIERGEKAREAGEKYLRKLNEKAPKGLREREKTNKKDGREDWILRALHWLNIPTRDDIHELNKKVEALMKKVA